MYLLFDIGRSKTRVAKTKDLLVFSDPKILETPTNFNDGLNLILTESKTLVGDEKIQAVAVGISRAVWPEVNLTDVLQKELGCQVFLVNDAALVGLGEARFGAGRGSKILAYITISSGVGGARLINGKIDEATNSFEPGHQIINFDDKTICSSCGKNGHLEGYVSGGAIEKRMGLPPKQINDDNFWNQTAKTLSYGLHNLIMCWSPDRIVLGGSMMKVPGIKIDDVLTHLNQISTIYNGLPELKRAELGDIGGIYGAQELLRQKLN